MRDAVGQMPVEPLAGAPAADDAIAVHEADGVVAGHGLLRRLAAVAAAVAHARERHIEAPEAALVVLVEALRAPVAQATAAAPRHVFIADARKARCVLAEVRWR